MTKIHTIKPLIAGVFLFLCVAYINVYEVRNSFFAHLGNPKKTPATDLKTLKKTIHTFCAFAQQIKSYWITKRLFWGWLFVKVCKKLLRGHSKMQLERLFPSKQKTSLPPGCTKQNLDSPLHSQILIRHFQGLSYPTLKGMKINKAGSTEGEDETCYGCDCRRSQIQRYPKDIWFSFLCIPYFINLSRVSGYNIASVYKNHAVITGRKIENDAINQRDFCYATKYFKEESISVDVFSFATVCKHAVGDKQKSLHALKGLHLVENSTKPTKKSVRKLYLGTQISPTTLSAKKSNQPKLQRVMLSPPPTATVPPLDPTGGKAKWLPAAVLPPPSTIGIRHGGTASLPLAYLTSPPFGYALLPPVAYPLLPLRVPCQVGRALAYATAGKHTYPRGVYPPGGEVRVEGGEGGEVIGVTVCKHAGRYKPTATPTPLPPGYAFYAMHKGGRGVKGNILSVAKANTGTVAYTPPKISVVLWYNLLFDFLPISCYGIRLLESQLNAAILKRVFIFSTDLPLLVKKRNRVHCICFTPLGVKVSQEQITKSKPGTGVACNLLRSTDWQKPFRTSSYPTPKPLLPPCRTWPPYLFYPPPTVVIRHGGGGIDDSHMLRMGFGRQPYATLPYPRGGHVGIRLGEGGVCQGVVSKLNIRQEHAKNFMSRYGIINKTVYWLHLVPRPTVGIRLPPVGGRVVTFLNYKPLYKQLVSKIDAASNFQAIFCYPFPLLPPEGPPCYAIGGRAAVPCSTCGWPSPVRGGRVMGQNQGQLLFATLFHPYTWVSWFSRSEQTSLVKTCKKGSHLFLDVAPLKKDPIRSFFKQYLLYLKKLISQPVNLPLPFLITKLNRLILSWESHLYLFTLPETQKGGVKNLVNNPERADTRMQSMERQPMQSIRVRPHAMLSYPRLPGLVTLPLRGGTFAKPGRQPHATSPPATVGRKEYGGWGGMRRGGGGRGDQTSYPFTGVAQPITQCHTHGLTKPIFYKKTVKYLESYKKKQQSQYLNFYICKLLWKLVKKRHPTQSNRWLFEKHWKFTQNIPYFYAADEKKIYFVLSFSA